MNIDKCIWDIKDGKILSEETLKICCEKFKELMIEESNV